MVYDGRFIIIIQIVLCEVCRFHLYRFGLSVLLLISTRELQHKAQYHPLSSRCWICGSSIADNYMATVAQDGFVSAFDSFGIGFAVIIFEIHVSLRYLWETDLRAQ